MDIKTGPLKSPAIQVILTLAFLGRNEIRDPAFDEDAS